MPKIAYSILLFWLAMVCLGCGPSSPPPPKISDAEASERLVGKWKETGDTGGIVTNEFTKDGKYRSEGVEKRPQGETKFVITATWKISGGVLTYTIESSKPKLYEPGETLEEKVLSIDEREFMYRDVNGKVQTMVRLP
jgi:uncharacterized protein (TIGR03066 family)